MAHLKCTKHDKRVHVVLIDGRTRVLHRSNGGGRCDADFVQIGATLLIPGAVSHWNELRGPITLRGEEKTDRDRWPYRG